MSVSNKSFSSVIYICDCGYETLHKSNANKHIKSEKCNQKHIIKKKVEFVTTGDNTLRDWENLQDIKHKYDEYISSSSASSLQSQPPSRTISQTLSRTLTPSDISYSCDLENEIKNLKNILKNILDENDYINGLIYYVRDGFDSDKAKIGICYETDIKELHTIFSDICSNEPVIFCMYSKDIRYILPHMKQKFKDVSLWDDNYVIHNDISLNLFMQYASEYNMKL